MRAWADTDSSASEVDEARGEEDGADGSIQADRRRRRASGLAAMASTGGVFGGAVAVSSRRERAGRREIVAEATAAEAAVAAAAAAADSDRGTITVDDDERVDAIEGSAVDGGGSSVGNIAGGDGLADDATPSSFVDVESSRCSQHQETTGGDPRVGEGSARENGETPDRRRTDSRTASDGSPVAISRRQSVSRRDLSESGGNGGSGGSAVGGAGARTSDDGADPREPEEGARLAGFSTSYGGASGAGHARSRDGSRANAPNLWPRVLESATSSVTPRHIFAEIEADGEEKDEEGGRGERGSGGVVSQSWADAKLAEQVGAVALRTACDEFAFAISVARCKLSVSCLAVMNSAFSMFVFPNGSAERGVGNTLRLCLGAFLAGPTVTATMPCAMRTPMACRASLPATSIARLRKGLCFDACLAV